MLLAGYLGTPEAARLMEKASFRTQFGPKSGTELARMLHGAGVQLVWTAPTLKDVAPLKKWRGAVRKILTEGTDRSPVATGSRRHAASLKGVLRDGTRRFQDLR